MGQSVWPDGMINSDWYEVAGLMREYERQNDVRIELTLSATGTDERPDLVGFITAHTRRDVDAVPVLLASARLKCSQERFRGLKGLCFYLLYQVDFQLAARELTPHNKNRA